MAMCRYLVADGRHCTEEAGDHDLCRWHDPAAAHNTPDTAEALERYVRQGGLCHGLQLARRSEERRVGKECRIGCGARWAAEC